MHLPGVGPKKTPAGLGRAGVGRLRDLEQACREGRVAGVPGMGEKTEDKLLARHRSLGGPGGR